MGELDPDLGAILSILATPLVTWFAIFIWKKGKEIMAAIDNFNNNVAALDAAIANHIASVDGHIASKASSISSAISTANAAAESHVQAAADKVAQVTTLITAETAKLNASM